MNKKADKRKLKRMCLVCGKKIYTTVFENGKYTNDHYFGKIKLSIEGTREWKKTGTTKIGKQKIDVVKWTGKEKEIEYRECNVSDKGV